MTVAGKWRTSRIAHAALAGISLLACSTALKAQTSGLQAAPNVSSAALNVSVPAGPLEGGLLSLGRQLNLRLLYPSALTAGKQTSGVSGRLAPHEAVARLLAGTGLRYTFTGANTVQISGAVAEPQAVAAPEGAIPLDTIDVQGTPGGLPAPYAGGQVATGGQLGILGNRDVMNTPFNVTNYTAKTIQDQQARSVADVVRNDPAVRNTWSDGGYSNQFFIRGFPVGASEISINGLYGVVPYQLAGTAFVERVEILKGPSAFLNGMAPLGAIGGTINLVPKRAPDDPLARMTLGYISNAQFGGQFDVARRFGDNKEWGVRFNGAYTNGRTPNENQTSELGQAALALDYRGDRVRLSVDLNYQKNYGKDPTRPVYFNPGFAIPAAPKNSSSLGQPWYYADGKDVFGIVSGEVDITDNITAFASVGARRNDFFGIYSFLFLTNSAGDALARQYVQPTYSESLTGQAGVRTKFNTGPVRHEVTISATGLSSELGIIAPFTTYNTNIYNPVYVPPSNLSSYATKAPRTNWTRLSSYSVSDSVYLLDDKLQLILGARLQQINIINYAAATGVVTSAYDKSAVTPATGIVIRPWQNVSFYANYIEGLSSGSVAPVGTTNAGSVLPPIRSKQVEAGVKVDFGRITTTLAAFQIEQPIGLTQNGIYSLAGEQRNRGLDFNVFGELSDGLRLLGGVTLMDGVLTKTAGGTNNGKKAIGVPNVQLNLGAEWDVPQLVGLTLTGRAIYTSSQFADVTNLQSIPAWTRFDMGARYTFQRENGKPVTIRANVENVFDKSYWSAVSTNMGLARGAPRTFLLSATFDF